jgi:hypothetical protein
MKLRLWLVLTTCIVSVSLIPSTAAADRPTREEVSPVGDQFACGETVLTVESGTLVSRTHRHELKSGRVRVIDITRPRGVTATDEEGVVYRVVGPTVGNFTFNPEAPEGSDVGFFRFKINFIGPGGLFGRVDFRIRFNRNGEEFVRDRGSCGPAEDD